MLLFVAEGLEVVVAEEFFDDPRQLLENYLVGAFLTKSKEV